MASKEHTKTNPMLYVLATVGVIAIIIAVAFLVLGRSASGNNLYTTTQPYYSTSQPTTSINQATTTLHRGNITVYPSGDVFSIPPGSYNGSYEVGAFSLNGDYATNVSITGSFTSQEYVYVALLSPEQYGAFTQNSSHITSQYGSDYYEYTKGANLNLAYPNGLASGVPLYIIFYDPDISTTDVVTIVNPITVTYTWQRFS